MKSRLNDIPTLKSVPTYIEAEYYNRIRTGLKRFGSPLRIELINLRGLDFMVEDDAWVCVDRTMNDLPILAWIDFELKNRSGLQESVPCHLRFFHSHADLICGTVLDIVYRQIDLRLANLRKMQPQTCEVRYIRHFR